MKKSETDSTVSRSPSLVRHVWWVVALGALALVFWINGTRAERVDYLTRTPGWSVDLPQFDAHSPTGYANGQRRLIVPGHHNPSYELIAQTQAAIAEGKWRLREVGYDNAPEGREVARTAPYRWYLTSLAWLDQLVSKRSMQQAVEHAALYADPALQGLLIASGAAMVAWRLGTLASCLVGFAALALFPLGGNFQPGAPDEHALFWLFAFWSCLPLLLAAEASDGRERRRWMLVAGVFTGLGLWVDAQTQTLLLAGIAVGGIGHAALQERNETFGATRLPWLSWALAAVATGIFGYTVEFVPDHVSWNLDAIHPTHLATVLGVGLLVGQVGRWRQKGRAAWRAGGIAVMVVSVLALAALPLAMWRAGNGFGFSDDPYAMELANHPLATVASSSFAWLARDGVSGLVLTALAPVAVLLWAIGMIVYPGNPRKGRARLALMAGPAMAGFGLALFHLRDWNLFDVVLMPLAAALALPGFFRRETSPLRWGSVAGCFVLLLPGFLRAAHVDTDYKRDLNELEVQMVIERDLAYWLRSRSREEKPIAFSTPSLSETLQFYGGLRSVCSNSPANHAGVSAMERIASASTWDEALLLLGDRKVSYVVLPTWDRAFDTYIRIARHTPFDAPLPDDTLIGAIQHWNLPPWLRPMPYSIPKRPVFEDFAAVVLSKEAAQEEPYATCRLAEYFLEMGMAPQAAQIRDQLSLYPRDLAALATSAQISLMIGDRDAFDASLEALLPYLSRRSARNLPFDRRVSLAVLLVGVRKMDEAKAQMQIVLDQINEERIQSLTTSALVRTLAITSLLDLKFPDPQLRATIMELVPPGVREKMRGR